MNYKLYTLVDITNTGQHRHEPGMEQLRWKEQNFQTVLQTLGMRANIVQLGKPTMLEVGGRAVGFDIDDILHVWRFDFATERDYLFELEGDPVGFLKEDFDMVPYIDGLDESMQQNYNIFVTDGPAKNIVFQQRQ